MDIFISTWIVKIIRIKKKIAKIKFEFFLIFQKLICNYLKERKIYKESHLVWIWIFLNLDWIIIYHPLRPVLDHSSDYTYYGNSLPQPCPPPSNLSATTWKNRSKVPSRESDHAQPCPTLWFFKSKADGPVWKEEGLLAAEDWTPKGYIYCRTKKNNNSDFCSR